MPSHCSEPAAFTGLRRADAPFPEPLLNFLRSESARFCSQIAVPRPWHYGELHNPWSRAAAVFDSWGFLDICESSKLVDKVATLIGPDIVLFDSQWLPDRWQQLDVECPLESDAHRFPVDPSCGLTVLIGVAEATQGMVWVHCRHSDPGGAAEGCAETSVDLAPGTTLFLDSRVPYRVSAARDSSVVPSVFAVRYFPASSRYNRDPAAPVQRALTERYPLFNYARMPLWLVHGQDLGGNDFVTGFNARAGYWTNAKW